MGKKNEDTRVEQIVLLLFTVHYVCMCISAIVLDLANWLPVVLVLLLAVNWGSLAFHLRSAHFRAHLAISSFMLALLIYSALNESVKGIYLPLAFFILAAGIYGYTDVAEIEIIGLFVMFFYHIAVAHNIPVNTLDDVLSLDLDISNLVLIVAIMYVWNRSRVSSIEKLEKTVEELELLKNSKDDFLANVSHEIRTPINSICGISEIALQETDANQLKTELCDIQMAGKNLISVVSDVLDFSELQSGKMDLVEESYNITSTIQDVVSMAMAYKADKPIELIVDCNANLPSGLIGDEKKIRRVIMNLLSNAIKFTNQGGVTLTIDFRKETYGGNLVITITDTGIGMSEDALSNLFGTFNMVDASRTRQEGGIGLGIAISDALVRKMGGIITAKSKLGKGTTMRVTLPQHIVDEQPIVQFEEGESYHVISYFNGELFEQRDVRDSYELMYTHMDQQLKLHRVAAKSFSEFSRRVKSTDFTHAFVSIAEYKQHKEYFDQLADTIKLIVVVNQVSELGRYNPKIQILMKPMYLLSFLNALRGFHTELPSSAVRMKHFIAPEAHVLAVDDNDMNNKVITGLLSRYKIRVTAVSSGQEAIDVVKKQHVFDFIFMDHMMPEMDGIETLHRIRQLGGEYANHVPIIALTANAVAGVRETMLEEGFNDFLEKPVELSVLERVLVRNLPESKLVEVEAQEENRRIGEIQQEQNDENLRKAHDTDGEEIKAGQEGTEKEDRGAEKPATDGEIHVGDLDVKTGLLYCGGEVMYRNILQEYANKDSKNWEKIEGLYGAENWTDYTIAVHAIKSSMKTIGAMELSEMAKELEMAGKAGNIQLIQEKHGAMIYRLKNVIHQIQKADFVGYQPIEAAVLREETSSGPKQEAAAPVEETETIPVEDLSPESFASKINDFETAVFALDEESMKEILKGLLHCTYRNMPLSDSVNEILHKVEMFDYMSALDAIGAVKSRFEEKGEQNA